MSFGIDLRVPARRGLFRRAPDPRELAHRLDRIARRMFKGKATPLDGDRGVALALHRWAPAVELAVGRDGELAITGDTFQVGPGYHADVLARLAPLLDELEYAVPAELGKPDERGVQRATCAWLAAAIQGDDRSALGVTRSFVVDAPVLTMLGPRDAAWRDRVIAEPLHAADAFAWWDTASPGAGARSRALLAMWHDVAWREPIDNDEIAVLERVDKQLAAAHEADPELALPWSEWALLHRLLARDDAEVAAIAKRAAEAPATIGYRRYDLDVEPFPGWTLRIPGAFLGMWDDDDRYLATDGDRAIELTALTVPGERDSAKLIAVAAERYPVIDRFVDGDRHGRAEATDDGDVHVVHGLVAHAPQVMIVTCKGPRSAQPWMLATWKSLRYVGD